MTELLLQFLKWLEECCRVSRGYHSFFIFSGRKGGMPFLFVCLSCLFFPNLLSVEPFYTSKWAIAIDFNIFRKPKVEHVPYVPQSRVGSVLQPHSPSKNQNNPCSTLLNASWVIVKIYYYMIYLCICNIEDFGGTHRIRYEGPWLSQLH